MPGDDRNGLYISEKSVLEETLTPMSEWPEAPTAAAVETGGRVPHVENTGNRLCCVLLHSERVSSGISGGGVDANRRSARRRFRKKTHRKVRVVYMEAVLLHIAIAGDCLSRFDPMSLNDRCACLSKTGAMQSRLGMEQGIPLSCVFVGAPIVRIVHPWLEVALLWYTMYSSCCSMQLV